jgi:hypothetical protein
MADNLQNTSNIDTNSTPKAGLTTDLDPSYIGKDQYSHARNAVRASKDGDLGTIGNEPSTKLSFSAPYKIIGIIPIPENDLLVFSTDNFSSEIGIGNELTGKYTTLLNASWLNFNDEHLIRGAAKKDFQKGTIVTFLDKYNPVRRIELKKISSVKSADDILLFKKIDHPCIEVSKGQVGNMPNGVYSVAVAYIVDNQIFSDFYSITNRITLFSQTSNNSLDIKVSKLDNEFKEFCVVVVGNYVDPVTKGATKIAKIVGTYSTAVKTVSVTDFINSNYEEIPLSRLVIQKKSWQKAGIISSNSNYLLIGDLVSREEENYQIKAMTITAEYVVEQVPIDYYENDGRDVGFYRDENYDFYIQGVYNTGETTEKYHIPGPIATSAQICPVSSTDVYEHDEQFNDCDTVSMVPLWKVENTAGELVEQNNKFKCDRRVLGTGKFGYFESTERYANNKDMFGIWANTPIRYFKFPDECKVPRYSVIGNKTYINILGIRFNGIPAFDNPDIVGYKITRSDRKGGNGTVVARGLMTNVRSYKDNVLNKEIYYSNYTVNDLNPDTYLSSTQTAFKNKSEHNYTPLSTYHLDKFSFYSPHTLFEPRYSLGTEVKIEAEEIAEVTGKFEKVFRHPQQKLMTQFSFWLAAAVGFIEAATVIAGRTTAKGKSTTDASVTAGVRFDFETSYEIKSADDLISLNLVGYITDAIKAGAFDKLLTAIPVIINSIASLGLKIPYSVLSGIKVADDTLNIIYNLTGYTDYVYQYNAHAKFVGAKCIKSGDKRRRVLFTPTYIPSTNVTVNNTQFNNLGREKTVYLHLNKPVAKPTVKDNTRNTISGFGNCANPFDEISSTGSAFYATSKVPNPNQYGQLGSAMSVSMHSCPISFGDSPILYGGDCVITRFKFQKKMKFFSQDIAGTNYPNGTEYDYRKYRGIAYPRFWIDSTKYDFSEIFSGNVVNFTRFSRTTTSKHNLDCKAGDKKNIARVDDAYMYISNNAVMDFVVEADYNPNFRDLTKNPFYYEGNTDLSDIFRHDRLSEVEEFNISRVYSDLYTTEIYAKQQRLDFNPLDKIPAVQPNSVIYSLPSFNLQEVDNWQYFLPANYFAFRESDYGKLTTIHKLDQDRLIFLFSKSSPFVSMGRDFLELEQSGRKITIGDGGLFAQDPREIMPTDNNYGASSSRYAFSNTHLGRFYPSENQGRIFSFTDNIDDISRNGMSFWCKNYMPIRLYEYFPTYDKEENPVTGVGYLSVFNSNTETIYVTKRDFAPKAEYASDISYSNGSFYYKGNRINLRSSYFNDISWTLSYSPIEKAFVSWHDWHPDLVVQRDKNFLSVKDKGVWVHDTDYSSFCSFYGKQYPFEIEVVSASGQQMHVVRSIEYILEAYKYKNFGRDRFHVLNANFDKLIVRNTEQISCLLNLLKSPSNPEDRVIYPKLSGKDSVSYDILFDKEENKYRVNQFWDSVRDRGEFTKSEVHLFPTDESGYKQVINPVAIDLNKPEEQRKKFRHYYTKFRFIKSESGENKLLMKVANVKKLISIR